ncbi:hypothetical protein ACFQX4_18835 [Roseomonas sp. GCM10028921]
MLRRIRSLARGLRRIEPGQLLGKLQSLERASGVAARNAELAAWNTKVLGSAIASQFYEAGGAGRLAPLPPDPVVSRQRVPPAHPRTAAPAALDQGVGLHLDRLHREKGGR